MKKVKTYRGWTIYQTTGHEIFSTDYLYLVFLPGMNPNDFDIAEFECDSLQECIDNIKSY